MGEHKHKLAIFRGRLKFKSNVQKIWGVLIFLSIVTAVEVALGILKPPVLLNYFLGIKILNWIFIKDRTTLFRTKLSFRTRSIPRSYNCAVTTNWIFLYFGD